MKHKKSAPYGSEHALQNICQEMFSLGVQGCKEIVYFNFFVFGTGLDN